MIPVLHCPHCGWSTLGGGMCRYCEGPLRHELAAKGTVDDVATVEVCDRCGVLRPSALRKQPCGECDGTVFVTEPSARSVLVATRVLCRRCSRAVAHPPDRAGKLDCGCGATIDLDPGLVAEVQQLAQAVGDLSGPAPEGRSGLRALSIARRNPYRDVGVTKASATQTFEREGTMMHVRVARGSERRILADESYRSASDGWVRRWVSIGAVSDARLRLEADLYSVRLDREVALRGVRDKVKEHALVGAVALGHVAMFVVGALLLRRGSSLGAGLLAGSLALPTLLGYLYLRERWR